MRKGREKKEKIEDDKPILEIDYLPLDQVKGFSIWVSMNL